MIKKKSQKTESSTCICQGAGPLVSEFLHRIGPPREARRHFEAARIEFLKGLRALIDARIEQISRAETKGQKISVQ
jgi:hypothetical protein